jgi:hypothetical protein
MDVKPSESDLRYLEMSEDELLLAIGTHLAAPGFGAKPPSDVEKRNIASRWFEARLSQLRKIICENQQVKAQFGPGTGDRNTLFGILFDAFTASSVGVPAGAVAAQIMLYGCAKLCPVWKAQ